jgi:hypothetical protein
VLTPHHGCASGCVLGPGGMTHSPPQRSRVASGHSAAHVSLNDKHLCARASTAVVTSAARPPFRRACDADRHRCRIATMEGSPAELWARLDAFCTAEERCRRNDDEGVGMSTVGDAAAKSRSVSVSAVDVDDAGDEPPSFDSPLCRSPVSHVLSGTHSTISPVSGDSSALSRYKSYKRK